LATLYAFYTPGVLYVPNVAKEEYNYEISVRSMNIDDRPTSGPIHTFLENFKWP